MTSRQTIRLRKLAPSELSDEQRELYEAITGGPRAKGRQSFSLTDPCGGLEGPFNAMLLSPSVGGALQALGSAVRYASEFTGREREIAILVIARHWDSAYERHAHEAVGLAAGLSDEELRAVRDGEFEAFPAEAERLIARLAHALAARGDLADAEYEDALAQLGERKLFELTTLAGYYATLALQLRVYRVAVPE